jgi:hypothetical protein
MLQDVFDWTILVGAVVFAFAVALHHTVSNISSVLESDLPVECAKVLEPYHAGVGPAARELVHVLLSGNQEMDCFEEGTFWLSGATLMYLYQLIVIILYLNMLIGMMGNTLGNVEDETKTRQYVFTNIVIRYRSRDRGAPAPFSLLRFAYFAIVAMPHFYRRCTRRCCPEKKAEEIYQQRLTRTRSRGLAHAVRYAVSNSIKPNRLTTEEQRDEDIRAKCLDLHYLKKFVDDNVKEQQEEAKEGTRRAELL